jgi:hypothetical protein
VRDLLVITPTRGRPDSAARMVAAVKRTAVADTQVVLGVDEDDSDSYQGFEDKGCWVRSGPRMNCADWSNRLAKGFGQSFRYLASMSDDHVPVTPGWDGMLIAEIEDMGGTGIAYGDDGLQGKNLPTSWVMSSDIVEALGWMYCPPMTRLFCDNVIKDIGEQAGCLSFVPSVSVRHMHWTSGLSPKDQTAIDGEGAWAHDEAAYHEWQRDRMTDDVQKIRALLGR